MINKFHAIIATKTTDLLTEFIFEFEGKFYISQWSKNKWLEPRQIILI